MRIDAHQHFWIYDPIRESWITEEMQKIQHDFLPSDLVPILKENNIGGCVAVQVDTSEKETEFLVRLAHDNRAIKGVVGWIDLTSNRIEERLDYFSQFKVLKGFRHMIQSEPDDDFMMRDDFNNGISHLEKHGYTYDLLIYPRHIHYATKLARAFPTQKFVVDHLAKPPIKSRQIDRWSSDMEALAANKNVFCKVSGMITEADWKNWTYQDLVPYLEVIVHCFGTQRIMYGSDWPVCLLAGSYREQLHAVEKYFRTFLDREQAAVFGENAAAFYNL